MKRFKTRKKHRLFKFLFLLLLIYFSFKITLNYLNKNIKVDPEKYIKYLVSLGLNNQINTYSNNNFLSFSKPKSLIEHNLSFTFSNQENEVKEYIEKVNEEVDEPIIYIYNTHESEEYKLEYKYEYSMVPNVKLSSYILQEKLDNYNIKSIVETRSIKDILNQNNWLYKDSYNASRVYLEDCYKTKPSLKYFIDIHRDSSKYEKTTLEYNNKRYAKILFVVGKEHDNYSKNLSLANKISDLVNNKIPELSKGIALKEGLGVNGIYNQDFSYNSMLIEIGGVDNNIIEVSNTINILGEILANYIKETNI